MPGHAIAHEAASGSEIYVPSALLVFDPHAASRDRVAEMGNMKMPFMANAWRKRAAENSLPRIFVQVYADGLAPPPGLQGIRQQRQCAAGGREHYATQQPHHSGDRWQLTVIAKALQPDIHDYGSNEHQGHQMQIRKKFRVVVLPG